MASKTKLGLHLPTDPRWIDLTKISLEDILTDHAYCEQKAATACISLIQQYPDKIRMVRELAPIVTEEWGHFRQVLRLMEEKGCTLGRQRKDEYVNKMMHFIKKDGSRDGRLVERLLLCALIEARSAERFRLLSIGLEDQGMKSFYHDFMVSEAGHYRMFLDLAYHYGNEEKVKTRWQEILNYEAEVINGLEVRGDRMH